MSLRAFFRKSLLLLWAVTLAFGITYGVTASEALHGPCNGTCNAACGPGNCAASEMVGCTCNYVCMNGESGSSVCVL